MALWKICKKYLAVTLDYGRLLIAWKMSKYGVISGPHFPVLGLNTQIYTVNLRIQSVYKKIRTRGNSAFGHFSRSDWLHQKKKSCTRERSAFNGLMTSLGSNAKIVNCYWLWSIDAIKIWYFLSAGRCLPRMFNKTQ